MSFIHRNSSATTANEAVEQWAKKQGLPVGVERSIPDGWPTMSLGLRGCRNAHGCDVRLPVGSLSVMIEDEPTRFAHGFLGTFIADGLVHQHELGLLPGALVHSIPRGRSTSVSKVDDNWPSTAPLRIAWRYNENPYARWRQNEREVPQLVFDWGVYEDGEQLKRRAGDRLVCMTSLDDLESFFVAGAGSERIRRLAVRSLHHYFVPSMARGMMQCAEREAIRSMWHLLHRVRRLCRETQTTALITLSRSWGLLPEMLHVADQVIEVNTCGGQGTVSLGLGKYDGIVGVVKAPTVPGALRKMRTMVAWSMPADTPRQTMVVFRWARRQLVIDWANTAPQAPDETRTPSTDW